ncbi:hypothetical protein [Secundilactobacillus silagei]|uniref:hypothetical protein n=1 Tax=Secundilactobacillus silagei TaxID=1293415 RepID=UPI000A7DD8F3
MGLDDADLLLVDRVIAYNHRQQKVTLSQIIPTDELAARYDTVIEDLKHLQNLIINAQPKPLPRFALTQPFHFQFSLAEFTKHVAVAQKHIVDGDIFQLIFSNPQQAAMSGSLLGVAPTLFKDSPSPYQSTSITGTSKR